MKIRRIMMVLLVTLSFVGNSAKASTNLANLEAMFIYNFLRLVNWPTGSAGETFIIGVYGNSQIYDELVSFTTNRKVGSKSIEVKKIANNFEAKQCQLVFIPREHTSKISGLHNDLGDAAVLVVGEKEGATDSGASIEFVLQGDKLKFRVNEEHAKKRNLVISRALIDMAV